VFELRKGVKGVYNRNAFLTVARSSAMVVSIVFKPDCECDATDAALQKRECLHEVFKLGTVHEGELDSLDYNFECLL
jgi:hypothetical protein